MPSARCSVRRSAAARRSPRPMGLGLPQMVPRVAPVGRRGGNRSAAKRVPVPLLLRSKGGFLPRTDPPLRSRKRTLRVSGRRTPRRIESRVSPPGAPSRPRLIRRPLHAPRRRPLETHREVANHRSVRPSRQQQNRSSPCCPPKRSGSFASVKKSWIAIRTSLQACWLGASPQRGPLATSARPRTKIAQSSSFATPTGCRRVGK